MRREMTEDERNERLTELCRVLRRVPAGAFVENRGFVNYAICVAAQDEWFKSHGLLIEPMQTGVMLPCVVWRGIRIYSTRAIELFFGLSTDVVTYFFEHKSYRVAGPVSPKHLIDRIEAWMAYRDHWLKENVHSDKQFDPNRPFTPLLLSN